MWLFYKHEIICNSYTVVVYMMEDHIEETEVTGNQSLVMHRYHYIATDLIPILFRQKMADTSSMPILWDTNIIYKQVDILISKNQLLKILYFVCNHYLHCHDTVINNIKYKHTFNYSIVERLISLVLLQNSTLNNWNTLLRTTQQRIQYFENLKRLNSIVACRHNCFK